MISCIIIDDEKKAREALHKIIARYFPDKLKVLRLCPSVKDGVEAIKQCSPDIVFLDIEMPNENGFKLFGYFEDYNFEVIFSTAYAKYAIDAIKFAALDYLLKPVNFIDLEEVLKRLEKKRATQTNQIRIETLVDNFQADSIVYSKLALPVNEGFHMERLNNIIYCQADEAYTSVHTVNKDVIFVSKAIGLIEEMLPENIFFRIHKSTIVNLNYVKSYSRIDGYRIVLETGEELDVATRRNDAFLSALQRR